MNNQNCMNIFQNSPPIKKGKKKSTRNMRKSAVDKNSFYNFLNLKNISNNSNSKNSIITNLGKKDLILIKRSKSKTNEFLKKIVFQI